MSDTILSEALRHPLPWHLYLMGGLYVLAGINHFRSPKFYIKMMRGFPIPKVLNVLSGMAEIGLGAALCVPALSTISAWGLVALVLAVFPANINMYLNEKASLGVSKRARLIRLPLQLVLLYWAYAYTDSTARYSKFALF